MEYLVSNSFVIACDENRLWNRKAIDWNSHRAIRLKLDGKIRGENERKYINSWKKWCMAGAIGTSWPALQIFYVGQIANSIEIIWNCHGAVCLHRPPSSSSTTIAYMQTCIGIRQWPISIIHNTWSLWRHAAAWNMRIKNDDIRIGKLLFRCVCSGELVEAKYTS